MIQVRDMQQLLSAWVERTLDALAVRMHSKDLTRKELMEEETTSDILIAFAEGEDI